VNQAKRLIRLAAGLRCLAGVNQAHLGSRPASKIQKANKLSGHVQSDAEEKSR
jgi:hypothetical protein